MRVEHTADDVRLHHRAAVCDRRRDHDALQGRRQHPLLPEREPARVDLCRRILRPEEAMVLVQPARRALVDRRFEWRDRVVAEPLRVIEDRRRTELLADVAEDGVDRVLKAGEEAERAELLRPVLVGIAGVVDRLAVLGAVAGILEVRVRCELARVERGRDGHDLEGRARREEPARRAVQQRRHEVAAALDPPDELQEVRLLRDVRVVRRRRRHHEHAAGGRLERDDRPALPGERAVGERLQVRVDGEDEAVPLHGLTLEPVDLAREDRAEVPVRTGQVVVLGALEPRSVAEAGRIADDVRRQRSLGVAAEVQNVVGGLRWLVRGQHCPAVGGVDQPALDRVLGDLLDRVVLAVGQPSRGPGLPVRRREDQG